MSDYIIDGFDFHDMEPMKYWQPPSTWSNEKRAEEVKNRIYSGQWLGARKMDGAFYQFNKSMSGEMELIGRSKGVGGDYLDKIEWVPQFHEFFKSLPNGTSLIGEVVFPNNEGSKNTTTIMGCLLEKGLKRQVEGDKLHYYIFDCLAWNGVSYINKPFSERVNKIETTIYDMAVDECIDTAQYYSGDELWCILQEILANGGEGVVITKSDAKYEPGKRSSKVSLKIKKELKQTVDCVITGANAPTREYTGKNLEDWEYYENIKTGEKVKGNFYREFISNGLYEPVTKPYFLNWAGSLQIGLYDGDKLIHFGDLSGLTDEVKENWRNYVGRVVEVGGMEIFKDGGIRHPKLLQIRPIGDKDPKDCTIDQIK